MAGAEPGEPFYDAWTRYRSAIQVLYGSELRAMSGAIEVRPPALEEDLLGNALQASTALTELLAGEIETLEGAAYEITAIRLLALATIDMAIADDLAALAPTVAGDEAREERAQRPGSAMSAVLGDALAVLQPPSGDPFRRLVIAGGQELDLPQSKDVLLGSFDAATHGIVGDAAAASVSTVSIVAGAGAERLRELASFEWHDLMRKLSGPLRRPLHWAARFLHEGIEKLQAALDGPGAGAVEAVKEWASDVSEKFGAGRLESWLTKKYGVDGMIADLQPQIENSKSEPRNLVRAAGELEDLAARFHSQMTFARRAAWLVGRARKWLFHIHPPVSEVAVIFAAATATGCVVWLGDDYLDAPRGGWTSNLRFIRGVDPITREAV